MIPLGEPDPTTGRVHVGVLSHTADQPGGTKPESEYGLPGDGHVRQSYHDIHPEDLEHLADTHGEAKKAHQMSNEHMSKLKQHTEANK